ncbi:PIN domain-containing protein [Nostoc sp. FACHB-152]|uniref:type II toxin-antitoxin system VapC family toxin n=1 Tax=unclassified Nostoc TaxID=2593658 RepID=UPI001683C275|nr:MULTISPECIES: PIN domain-containing protein [unclassified Nostoc]MBD2450696.1 PIN domain-containing protein [Nostoc sp. FACHB-152]MBD2471908.1 PIN domain-containing protein [Nostoc sp. FACHB-145]
MTILFLDTSFIIALELVDEQYHQIATQYWQGLIKSSPKLVISSYVFDEIVTFFNSRNRHDKAVEVGNRLINSAIVDIVQVDEALFFEGWQYFQQHDDKSYSLTDCISFLVMNRLNIQLVLTFDKHFFQAGYQKVPM